MNRRTWLRMAAGVTAVLAGVAFKEYRHHFFAKRFFEVEPHQIYRGGWQQPGPLRRIVQRYRIRTILNVACRPDEPDAEGEGPIVREFGLEWHKLLMPGTGRGTFEQMDQAADVLANPANRPVFVHCDGGQHRTNMVLAAYWIKHLDWPLDRVVAGLGRYGFDADKYWRQYQHLNGYVAHVREARASRLATPAAD